MYTRGARIRVAVFRARLATSSVPLQNLAACASGDYPYALNRAHSVGGGRGVWGAALRKARIRESSRTSHSKGTRTSGAMVLQKGRHYIELDCCQVPRANDKRTDHGEIGAPQKRARTKFSQTNTRFVTSAFETEVGTAFWAAKNRSGRHRRRRHSTTSHELADP